MMHIERVISAFSEQFEIEEGDDISELRSMVAGFLVGLAHGVRHRDQACTLYDQVVEEEQDNLTEKAGGELLRSMMEIAVKDTRAPTERLADEIAAALHLTAEPA